MPLISQTNLFFAKSMSLMGIFTSSHLLFLPLLFMRIIPIVLENLFGINLTILLLTLAIFLAFSWVTLMLSGFLMVSGDSNWSSCKEEINTCVTISELDDLNYGGCQFTWLTNKVVGSTSLPKLIGLWLMRVR